MPVDLDRDGITDQYNVSMRIKKPVISSAKNALALSQLNLIMEFELHLEDVLKMSLQGVAAVNLNAYASDKLSASKLKT